MKQIPDHLAKNIDILFVGFNPSLRSAETGHHYANPNNRFWTILHQAGLTSRKFTAEEDGQLLELGYGFTNIVPRPTKTAAEITKEEYQQGRIALEKKIKYYLPKIVCFVGKGVYQQYSSRRDVAWGVQPNSVVEGVIDFVAPSSSGLVRMKLAEVVAIYRGLRDLAKMRILVMTAVEAEKKAVMRGLQHDKRFDVLECGVGPIAAAASTATALATTKYDLVVSAGIGGGFSGQTEVGSLVVSNVIISADLGAQTENGFCSLDELGYGSTRVQVDTDLVGRLAQALETKGLPVGIGPVLTVSTVTGSAETALALAKRVPEAMAEAMEGYGVAIAAQKQGIPILEIRAISNLVGPRDRQSWRIKEALEALETASTVLLEVLT